MCATGHQGLSDGSRQFEVDLVSTLPAARKYGLIQKCGFVHEPVRIVENTINAALWNGITGAKMFFHRAPHAYADRPSNRFIHYRLRPEMRVLSKGLSSSNA